MAFQIVWTDPALEALKALIEYISRDNPAEAERFGNKILHQVDLLEHSPFLGSRVNTGSKSHIRETACFPYRIFYRVVEEAGRIEILTLWHSSRDEPPLHD
ncbi:MAG TPA: type II toxin-antitoxin system RelE/ParE family toxin [Pirellulales bacterium]|jgi:plasmid stabilization system protein ParE|nr:type II toxin-antitoxin system RelE/ParE family toxin [Pirellulales bacterium]